MPSCQICGHVYGQMHRITPGSWGGGYELDNVAILCPNHHAAIHLLMKWQHTDGGLKTDDEWERLEVYLRDEELFRFWAEVAKPAVIQRKIAEGRYHPYVRTLPDKP